MTKLRILLIDADADRLEQFSSMLGEAEHTVLPVNSLEEAEEALFVLKIDVAIFGSSFADSAMEIFVDRLRGIENTQKNAVRAPVLAVASDLVNNPAGWTLGDSGIFDGHMAGSFDSGILAAALEGISLRGSATGNGANEAKPTDFPIFEPEKFLQQVAYDPELTIEIINLFLDERAIEIPEMQAAVETRNFQRLSEVAHTIKGSLSSLHAALARRYAQDLESAAKNRDEMACRGRLRALAEELDSLEPLLLELRDQVKR